MSTLEKMRKMFDECTVMAGVEPDFECIYITKDAANALFDEAEVENAKLRKLVQGFLSEHADYLAEGNYFIGDLDLEHAMRHNQAYFRREARKLGIEVEE